MEWLTETCICFVSHDHKLMSVSMSIDFIWLQAGMPSAPIPQVMMQPRVPSMWAQPGSYQPEAERPHFESELEINDFPQHARWKVVSTPIFCFTHCTLQQALIRRPAACCSPTGSRARLSASAV